MYKKTLWTCREGFACSYGYFLDELFFLIPRSTVQTIKKRSLSLLFHLTAVRHFKLAGDLFDSSVCIVMKVRLHQFKFGSLSFSVRTVLKKKTQPKTKTRPTFSRSH